MINSNNINLNLPNLPYVETQTFSLSPIKIEKADVFPVPSPFPSFPFLNIRLLNQACSSSEAQFDAELSTEIDHFLGKEEEIEGALQEIQQQKKEIEAAMSEFKTREKDQQTLLSALALRQYLYDYANFYNELAKQGVSPTTINFLQTLFPSEFISQPHFQHSLEMTSQIFNLITTFLQVADSASNGLILICRSKALKASVKALEIVKQALAHDSNLDEAQKRDRIQALHEWEANIRFEEKELAHEATKFGLKTAKSLFANTRLIGQLVPNSLFTRYPALLQGCDWISAGCLIIFSAITLKRTATDYRHLKQHATDQASGYGELPKKAKDLLEKRQKHLTEQKKALEQRSPENLIATLKACKNYRSVICNHNHKNDQEYEQWVENTIKEGLKKGATQEQQEHLNALLSAYVDHQNTLAQMALSTKQSLHKLGQLKYALERTVVKFRLFEASTTLTIATISLAIIAAVALLGLSLTPPGALALFILSIAMTAIRLSITCAGYYLSYKKNPTLWTTNLIYSNINLLIKKTTGGIHEYRRRSKYQILLEQARLLRDLKKNMLPTNPDSIDNYKKARELYCKAREAYSKQCKKVNQWNEKIEKLEKEVLEGYWQDFAKQAKLPPSPSTEEFDLLKTSSELCQQCDFTMMDQEARQHFIGFFRTQFGIDVEKTHDFDFILKSMKKFFSFDTSDLIYFIRHQNERQVFTAT